MIDLQIAKNNIVKNLRLTLPELEKEKSKKT